MVRTASPAVLVVALALTLGACSGAPSASAAEAARPAAAPPAVGQLPRLAFFMNPNGRPCQMQDQILRSMAGELSGRVEVVYYRTTEPAELARFEQYGIRSLPALVLTDASGAELRRATPGIQAEAQVRQLVAR